MNVFIIGNRLWPSAIELFVWFATKNTNTNRLNIEFINETLCDCLSAISGTDFITSHYAVEAVLKLLGGRWGTRPPIES